MASPSLEIESVYTSQAQGGDFKIGFAPHRAEALQCDPGFSRGIGASTEEEIGNFQHSHIFRIDATT